MKEVLRLNPISPLIDKVFGDKYKLVAESEAPVGILVRSFKMHEYEPAKSVLCVGRAGAGVNNIPLDRCAQSGIVVFNTPGANANAVKELVICGLLLASRRVVPSIDWCRTLKGEDEISKKIEKGKSNFAGPEIMGKTLGVIGLGAIGIKVCNAAVALGMNVIGYDPYLSDKGAAMLDSAVTVTAKLDDIFVNSDYISVHAPLTDSTKNIVGKETLAMAKDGVRVLNFARGGLVDNEAIVEAIKSGKCAAYATDFPTDEQLCLDGVIALPHLGASTPESEENCAVMAVNQIAEYLEKGNVVNSVNLPCISKNMTGGKRIVAITKGDVSAAVLAAAGSDDAVSAVRKDIGYVIVDGAKDDAVEAVKAVDGVVAVRAI